MTFRKALGFLLYFLPFVILFGGIAHVLGWLQAFGIFAIVGIIVLIFHLGAWLIQSGRKAATPSTAATESNPAACRFCGCETSAIASFPKRLAVTCSGCGATGPYALLSEHGEDYQATTKAAWAYWNGATCREESPIR